MLPAEAEKLAADMRAFGFPEEKVEAAVAQFRIRTEDAVFLVHPDNATAVRLFRGLQTQWDFLALSSMAGAVVRRVGLKYGSVEPVARMMGLQVEPDDFERLRIMEYEALAAWSAEQ